MDEQRRSRVSIINEDILSDKNLTPAEKMVYARICYFEEFFEGSKQTAEYLGVKEWTVQSAKRKLEKLGYIICTKNTGRGKRYVADVNFTTFCRATTPVNEVRPCSEQSQTLVKTKSDLGINKVRPWKNQDIGKNISKNLGKKENNIKTRQKVFKKPSVEDVRAYCQERENGIDPQSFIDYYESKGWVVGRSPMKDWKAAVRTWERNHYGNGRRQEPLYKPKNGEDITYQRMFRKWKQYLGVEVKQTKPQVDACKELLEDVGEDWVEKLIVALRLRSETRFVIREITAIQDFKGLADNRTLVMGFYNEHWREWQELQQQNQTGKKPWETA